ncbi:MAG: methyltransferase [Oscillospiraceae bacterium]|jgi:tRNA1(Val) A37 N6-methylase TrmN6|nr:methyltransferase [Oscillospiraceae bacterium]
MKDVRLEDLGGGVRIAVSREYGFGTDAVLLADFAKPSARQRVCDFGTGCGIIPLLWMRENPPVHTYGIEIQEGAFPLLNKSLEINNELSQRLSFFNADLRELKGLIPSNSLDLISCNPPYKKAGAGAASPELSRGMARHELSCTLEDVIKAAKPLLKFGGRLCMCLRPERTAELISLMHEHNLEPKRLRFVQQRADTPPWLVLVEGRKGAKQGVTCLPVLTIESAQDEYSCEYKEIYKLYGAAER